MTHEIVIRNMICLLDDRRLLPETEYLTEKNENKTHEFTRITTNRRFCTFKLIPRCDMNLISLGIKIMYSTRNTQMIAHMTV